MFNLFGRKILIMSAVLFVSNGAAAGCSTDNDCMFVQYNNSCGLNVTRSPSGTGTCESTRNEDNNVICYCKPATDSTK